jgi:hypothetical protein
MQVQLSKCHAFEKLQATEQDPIKYMMKLHIIEQFCTNHETAIKTNCYLFIFFPVSLFFTTFVIIASTMSIWCTFQIFVQSISALKPSILICFHF